MKITFLAINYAPSVGGAQSHVQRIAEGLVRRHGHEVTVLTTDALLAPAARNAGRIDIGREVINGVEVRRLPVARRFHSTVRTYRRLARRVRPGRAFGSSRLRVGPIGIRLALAALKAGRNSDVVVGVSSPFTTLMGADWATRRSSAAYVAMPLLHLAVEEPPEWIVKTLRRADGVSANTEFERDWLVANGIDSRRISVLPPGCDPDRYEPLSPSQARSRLGLPDRPTVGYIGRIAAQKGVDTFLRSAEMIWQEHPDTTLFVVGGRVGWDGYEVLLDELAPVAGDRLVLRDGFSEEERSAVFGACDVVAFPSLQESFGMITIEAWCARRPVVAADIGAIRCVVRPGSDGELISVGDSVALAEKVSALLGDPARRERYGAAGRERAENEFAWEPIIDRWASFLDSVADPSADRGDPQIPASGESQQVER